MDEPLHLLHQLKHLLRRQAGHCLGDHLGSILGGYCIAVDHRLHKHDRMMEQMEEGGGGKEKRWKGRVKGGEEE